MYLMGFFVCFWLVIVTLELLFELNKRDLQIIGNV